MTREERVGLGIIAAFVLAAGAFYGIAIGPGYVQFVAAATAPELSSRPAGEARPVGEAIDHVVLPRFGTLTGRLADSRSKAPLTDATISVRGLRNVASPRILQSPDGTFRIAALPLGRPFEIEFTRSGYSSRRLRQELALGAEVDIGAVELVHDVLLEGRVRDRLGQGVAGARISWYAPLPRFSTRSGPGRRLALAQLLSLVTPPVREVFTDASGRFSFGETPPAPLDLAAGLPGFTTTLRRGIDLRAGASRRYTELVLDRGLPFDGRLADERGQPVEGATLVALSSSSEHLWRKAATDSSGRFRFEELQPGSWAVAAAHPDGMPVDLGDITVPGPPLAATLSRSPRAARMHDILPPGWALALVPQDPGPELARVGWKPETPRRLTLPLGTGAYDLFALSVDAWLTVGMIAGGSENPPPLMFPESGATLTRSWCVADALSGASLEGVTIHATVAALPPPARPIARTTTDGTFTLRLSGQLPLSLFLSKEGFEPAQLSQEELESWETLTLQPARPLRVRLARPDADPIAHGRILAVPRAASPLVEACRALAPRSLEAETGPDGTAQFGGLPPGGEWSLVLITDQERGHVPPDTVAASIQSGEVLEIVLPAGAWVQGTVRDARGRPQPASVVRLELPETFSLAPLELEAPNGLVAITNDNGAFEIGPIPPLTELHMEARHGASTGARLVPPLEPGARVLAFDLDLAE
ncbi:MAG: carboxypeptidase-like regulatory domain-containing protein [Planctomycetota bacterium]